MEPNAGPNWTLTADNMEFEQVITRQSATLKGDLKVNLEPKWFLRRSPFSLNIPC